jgi:hypothetical protein
MKLKPIEAIKSYIVSFTIRHDRKLAAKYCRIKGDCWETRPVKASTNAKRDNDRKATANAIID